MNDTPFTVTADLDLGSRVAPYLRDSGGDVTVEEGEVPASLADVSSEGGAYQVAGDRFLLRIPNGASYLVEGGRRIVYARGGASDRDVALFLLGTAWGALCYQRGLIPLHASGVIHEGRVHAFTGISGAGKSTLAAALSDRGLSYFTDDVLIIDPELIGPHEAVCFAGQKDMKLWEDALELTGSVRLGAVRDQPDFRKFFAAPRTPIENSSGHLSSLTLLRNTNTRRGREPIEIAPVTGAVALKSLRDSVYRVRLASAIMGTRKLYTVLARLIAAVHVQTFDRPMQRDVFPRSTQALHDWIVSFETRTQRGGGAG
ncbi:hypothetical protein [Aurantiacibacter spongiae]|uniref:Serine kinase n=1 Tax=Aurantiacibacter spongiae TaxID=2488860 RepID=A0A3N5DP86_9SPHN|nr:hypothetical protein [Aurantiacibacter spongiae]RPF70921.1 hypothetical protein EG799_04270 [Aurantiacibacter spongiae]